MSVEKRDSQNYRWSQELTQWVPEGILKTTDLVLQLPVLVGDFFPLHGISNELIVADDQFVAIQIDFGAANVDPMVGTTFRIEASTKETGTDSWSPLVEFITRTSESSALTFMNVVEGTNAAELNPIPAGWRNDDYVVLWNATAVSLSEWHRIAYCEPGSNGFVVFYDNFQNTVTRVYAGNKAYKYQYTFDARAYKRFRATCQNSPSDYSAYPLYILWRCLASTGL